jgi:DNA-binding Lrp family transcriptional regulator
VPDRDFVTLFFVETDTLDAIDHQIIHLLTLDPRASFRTIADVVGVSDQTAARRYRRLRDVAELRVHGLINGPRAGWVDWLVRLQTTPGSANAIADALARRPDTRWVKMFAGGTEVMCVLQARTAEERNTLFLHGLPGSRRVVQISAHAALHRFGPVAWSGMTNALSAAQLEKLPGPGSEPEGPETGVGLQPGDAPLLAELARDGRTSNAELAAATHWHESTVRRRIADLCAAGLLYFDVDVDDAVLGFTVTAMLLLSVDPTRLDETGRAVAAHPEVPFAAAITGPSNLAVSAVFRDTGHMYQYISGRLAGLPGVRSVETVPAIGTFKRAGSLGWTGPLLTAGPGPR